MLIVDDNRDAADSLSELLAAMGAQTLVAYNGEDALKLAEAYAPQIAVLDIGMPGMDGCELARRLRVSPTNADMLLVALTGWGQQGDRERVAAAGFNYHLLKPVNLPELLALI